MNQIPNIEETHNTREVQPTESQALPHENIIKKCWNPDCRKVATCRDGSGWEWCDDHVDQEKTGSVLHTAQEYYDVDYYTALLKERLHQQLQKARAEVYEKLTDQLYGMNLNISMAEQQNMFRELDYVYKKTNHSELDQDKK